MAKSVNDYLSEVEKKYGSSSTAESASPFVTQTGQPKTVYDYLNEVSQKTETIYAESRIKAANNVQEWLDKYQTAYTGYNDYLDANGDVWDLDYGGKWYEQILDVLDGYEQIKGDAVLTGYDYAGAYADLKRVSDDIRNKREFMGQFDSEESYQTARQQQKWQEKYWGKDYQELKKTASGIEDPKEKEFVESLAAYGQMEHLRNLDIDAAEQEIAELERQRDEGFEYDWTDAASRAQAKQGDYANQLQELNYQITEKKKEVTQARRAQKEAAMSGVGDSRSQYYDNRFQDMAQYRGDSQLSRMINETEEERAWRKQQDAVWGESDFSKKGYDRLSQAEKDVYNYWDSYDSQNGTQKAKEYLDSLEETLNARKGTEIFEQAKDYNEALKLLSYTAVGMEGSIKGIADLDKLLWGKDEYTPATATQIAANMLLQEDRENGTLLPDFLQDEEGKRTWEELSGEAAMSVGNMIPSMAVGGLANLVLPGLGLGAKAVGTLSKASSLTVMGASIAGNAYTEAVNQGYSPSNAKAYAYANAASEIATEYMFGGIENMTGIGTDAMAEKLMKNMDNAIFRFLTRAGSDALGESFEEGIQAVIEPWINNITLDQITSARGEDVLYSMLSGLATATVMSGPSIALDEYSTYKTGDQAVYNGLNRDTLREVAGSFDAGTEAKRLSEKINDSTGAYTIGRTLNEVGAELSSQNIRDIRRYLENKGLPADEADHNAKLLNYIAQGGELSQQEIQIVNADDTLADAYREMVLNQDSQVSKRTQGYQNLMNKDGTENDAGTTLEDSLRNQNGDAALKNPNRSVLMVKSREGDTMQLLLKNGDAVDSSDMSAYHDAKEALLFDTARKFSADTAGANRIANGFEGSSVSMEEYCKGVEDCYRYGLYGMSYSEVKRGSLSSAVDAEAAHSAYMAGIREANTRVARQQKAAMEARQPGQETAVHFNRNGRKFDDKREAAIATMEQLSKALGVDFWVFESYEKNGSRVYADETGAEHNAPNGWYDDNGIHIDLNAGNDGRGVMLYTLAHELTHHIRKYSPEKFKAFADVVMKGYGDRDISAEDLIQKQISKAKKNGRDISYDEAYEEMIADSMEGILADGKVLEKLKGLQDSDPSLWEMVKRWAKDTAEKIRKIVDAYKGERMDSTEGKIVSNMKEILAQLEELYAEGLADSASAQMAGLDSTTTDIVQSAMHDSGVKYSERVTDKDTLDFLDGQDTVKTYKTMQLVDGKLYPPMASRIEGRYEDYSILGQWEQATEHPELIRENGKFKLDKGKGQGSIEAAYNPYMHSSNLVLNDQFSGAYARDNLVTVECEVPSSELTSGYRAEYAKDAVGWHAWHTGTVAGSLRKAKGIERQVFLSRWIKPVRIVPDSEVAAMYKTLLDGTDVAVPDNVVTPNLLSELKKAGVPIKESGKVKYSERPYSYESFVKKPDMIVTTVDGNVPNNRADVVYQAKQNAARIGKFNTKDGSISVRVKDIGRDVVLGTAGLKHSLDRRFDVNAPVTIMAGSILQNSILLNEMNAQHPNADSSYVLVGAAENTDGQLYVVRSVINRFSNEVMSMDVLYAYNAKTEPNLRIKKGTGRETIPNGPQRNAATITDSTISISELLDYVNDYFPDILPEDVLKYYGHDARPEGKLGESVLYSDRDPDAGKMNRILQKQNAELKDTVDYLRKLVRLQGKVTDGTVYTWGSVEAAARRLMNGAGAKGDVVELRKILERTYKAMGEGSEHMTELINEAAQWLVDHQPEAKPKLDSYAQEILSEIKGRSISLNDSQKAEAAQLVGKYGDYRRRFFGTLNLSDSANTSLDQFWQEMSGQYPDIFKPDISSSDMPRELYSAIDTLKSMFEESAFSPEEMAEADLNEQRMNVWENFTKLVPIKTTADRNKAQVEAIKQRYTEKIQSIRENYQSQIDQLKQQRREDVKAVRAEMQGKADAQQQAAKERFQQKKEDLKAARQDTQIIEREFLRLARECDKAIKAGDTAQSRVDSLKAALEAETKKHKQDNAMWEKEFQRLFREYEKADRNVDALQEKLDKTRAAATARVEGRKQTAIRNQLKDLNGKFQRMLDNPGKGVTAHAPTALTRAVADVCDLFAANLEQAGLRKNGEYGERIETLSGKLAENPELKYARNGIDAANRQQARIAEQAVKLGELRRRYAEIQNDGALGIFYDEHTSNLLKDLSEQLDGKDIYEMTSKELLAVKETMDSFYHSIVNANKIWLGDHDAELMNTAQQWGREINDVNVGFVRKHFGRLLNWQMRPDTFFSATSGFAKNNVGEQVQKMLAKGTERMLQIHKEYYNLFSGVTENKAYQKELGQLLGNPMGKKNLVDVGLTDETGERVLLTRGMALQLYMLLGQEDSRKALVYSGLKIPDQKLYYKDRGMAYGDKDIKKLYTPGLGDDAYTLKKEIEQAEKDLQRGAFGGLTEEAFRQRLEALRSQRDELVMGEETRLLGIRNNIEQMLTPCERACIETGRRWYARSGVLMADAFEETHGYRPKLVEDYVPIHRDGTTVWTDIRESKDAFNLENSGFLQERVENKNAIVLTDFFVELGSQRDSIARYCGFNKAQKDFNRLWKIRMPGMGRSINGMIAAKFGEGDSFLGVSGVKYIENYIMDIGGGRKGGKAVLEVFYGAAAAKSLSMNPRVAVSQLASIPTAAAEVGWKNMAVGFVKGLGTALSKEKKNALAQKNPYFFQRYRGEGGITEIADLTYQSGLWNRISKSKAGKWLFNWCQSMDVFATSTMYAMAEEAAVKRGISRSDPGFTDAANEIYTDILRKTQPNYTITERSDLLRDKRGQARLFNMFKTQSNQNLNILLQASGRFAKMKQDFKAQKNGVTAADVKKAREDLANAASAVVIGGNVAFVMLRAGVNLIWAQVKGYRDEETGEVTSDKVMEEMFKEFLSSMSGMFTLGDMAYDLIYSAISGEKYYGMTDSAIDTVCGAAEAVVNLVQKLSIPKDLDEAERDKAEAERKKAIDKAVGTLLGGFGVPYDNAKKFLDAYHHWELNIQKKSLFNYDDSGTTEEQYRNRFLNAYRAGDEAACDDILAILAVKADAPNERRTVINVRGGFRDSFKKKFLAGEITEDEVRNIMRNYLDASEEYVEQMIAGWKGKQETGMTLDECQDKYLREIVSSQEYIQYLRSYQGMDQKKAEASELRLRCERDTGYAYDEIKERYMADEISVSDAAKWLEKYGGVENARKKLKEYDFEDATGYSWADRRDCYLAGGVSAEDLKWWLQTIEGKRKADAESYVRDLDFERENGYAYNEKLEQYISGNISRQELKRVLMDRGQMFEAEADRELVAYDYIKNHPDTALSITTAYSYTRTIENWDYTIASSGLTEEQFLSFREQKASCKGTDSDGDGYRDSGSIQEQILPIIDSMPISEEQKDTLWFFCGWSKRTLNSKAPWKQR